MSSLQSTVDSIVDTIYPVGAVYISIESTSPASLFGGSWTAISSGYALWTTTSSGGSTLSAGLPNITGTLGFEFMTNTRTHVAGTGALSGSSFSGSDTHGGAGSSQKEDYLSLSFSASNSNSIYGNSSTVQPPAYQVYAWRRVS